MMRATVAGCSLMVVWFSSRPCQADPIRFHPSFAVGATVGTASEKTTCSSRGRFECPLPSEQGRALGLQASPHFEALVMVGRSTGFRLGVGLRYLPGFGLDTGRELQFALVPEMRWRLSPDRYVFGHFFNTLGSNPSPSAIRERQEPTLDACSTLRGVDGAHCRSWRSNLFLSLGLAAGVVDRFAGYGLRYGVGFQVMDDQNSATSSGYSGNDPDFSPDSLHVKYRTERSRGFAFVGVEW
jgi:hypothetical protein